MADSVGKLPVHQELLHSALRENDSALIDDLIEAAAMSLSPYSGTVTSKRYPTENVDWASAIDFGFEMLTDHKRMDEWFRRCCIQRSELTNLGHYAMARPLFSLATRLQGNWPLHDYVKGIHNRPCEYSTCNEAPKKEIQASDYAESASALAEITGFPVDIVLALSDIGILPTTNNTRRSTTSKYCLKTFGKLIAQIPSEDRSRSLRIANCLPLLKAFGIKWGDFAPSMFAKHPFLFRKNEHTPVFQDIWVPRWKLLRELVRISNSLASKRTLLDRQDLRDYLCLDRASTKTLVLEGYLDANSWNGLFELQDVRSLLLEYEVLPRWAFLHDIPLSDVLWHLDGRGIYPVCNEANLFRRTWEFHEALRELLINRAQQRSDQASAGPPPVSTFYRYKKRPLPPGRKHQSKSSI